MRLHYTIPIAIGLWWIPVIGPAIFGFVNAFIEKSYKRSLISTVISSSLASLIYILLSIYVIKIPLLGNFLPVITIILSLVGIAISIMVVYLVFSRITIMSVSNEGVYTEFYSSSFDEAKEKIDAFISSLGINLSDCPDPSLELSEKRIKSTFNCNGLKVQYEVTEELRGKYKVKVWIKG